MARATIIDPVSLSAERQAEAWLAGIDGEREVDAAAAVLNRVLYFHRVACADPYVREVSTAQALVIRAGWGEGEQVAGGHWRFARETIDTWMASGPTLQPEAGPQGPGEDAGNEAREK